MKFKNKLISILGGVPHGKYDDKVAKLQQCKDQKSSCLSSKEKLEESQNELKSALSEARSSIKELKDRGKSRNPQEMKDFFMYPEEQNSWDYPIHGQGRRPVRTVFAVSDDSELVAEAQKVVQKGNLRNQNHPTQIANYFYEYVESNWDWDYETDKEHFGKIEYWQSPDKSIKDMTGDCVAFDEEVITKGGIKTVEDIEEGDQVLSYDFDEDEYVYKPVINKWDKGEQEVKEVEFRNRKSIQVTENHPMMVRQHQSNDGKYEKKYLSDVDLSRWWKRKVPSSVNLQVETEDKEWFTKDHAYIFGHFCAEGWTEESRRASTSGHSINDEIAEIYDKLGIDYRLGQNGTGVPTLEILDEQFRNLCLETKENSFNINVPEWLLFLPEEKIEAFVDGYFLGDGHIKHSTEDNSFPVFSTSSQQFAEDLGFMLNRLGRPTYQYKQLNHGGVGDEPIYRVHTNPNSHFAKEREHENMGEASIKEIRDAGTKQVYDFEVKDTHTFFFKNGILTHNCDDLSVLMHWVLRKVLELSGFEEAKWRVRFVASRTLSGGHAYNIWLAEDCEWYVMESTMDMEGSLEKTWLETPLRENNFYYDFYGFATPTQTWRGGLDVVEPYEDEEPHYMET